KYVTGAGGNPQARNRRRERLAKDEAINSVTGISSAPTQITTVPTETSVSSTRMLRLTTDSGSPGRMYRSSRPKWRTRLRSPRGGRRVAPREGDSEAIACTVGPTSSLRVTPQSDLTRHPFILAGSLGGQTAGGPHPGPGAGVLPGE